MDVHCDTVATLYLMRARAVKPRSFAVAVERSSSLPRTHGPRSVTVANVSCLLAGLTSKRQVPSGRVR